MVPLLSSERIDHCDFFPFLLRAKLDFFLGFLCFAMSFSFLGWSAYIFLKVSADPANGVFLSGNASSLTRTLSLGVKLMPITSP